MSTKNGFSRRKFLAGGAAAAGAYVLSGGGRLEREASAQTAEKPALLLIFLRGGYNSLFPSADSFLTTGSFGTSTNSVQMLGNGLAVDKSTFGTMPAAALANMASIGVRHGISAHNAARMADLYMGTTSYPIALADALGGTAAIKAANVGAALPDGPNAAVNGTSLQTITDMGATIAALGGGAPDPNAPARDLSATSLMAAQTLSADALKGSGLVTLKDGYSASISALQKPIQPFSAQALQTAYGLGNTTAVTTFKSKMAAAELMIQAGANVVTAIDNGWDTHGDRTGTTVRNQMTQNILPGLNVFLQRMMADTTRNVVTMIFGDFARSLPGSDHQPNVTATVIGKYVKQGTTGRVDETVGLSATTPSVPGLWAFATAALKMTSQPFGANPHALIL